MNEVPILMETVEAKFEVWQLISLKVSSTSFSMPKDSWGSRHSAWGMWSKMDSGFSKTMKFVSEEKTGRLQRARYCRVRPVREMGGAAPSKQVAEVLRGFTG